jgi:hypothetical protein
VIYVIHAKYLEDYKIHVQFNDKKEGIIDLKDTIFKDHRPIFKELTNLSLFKNLHVDKDTIVWSNGLDLAPEFLYQHMLTSFGPADPPMQ